MAFKDLFIKEETAPAASTQKVVQEVQLTRCLEEVCK